MTYVSNLGKYIKYVCLATKRMIVLYIGVLLLFYTVFSFNICINPQSFGDTDLEMTQFIASFVPQIMCAGMIGIALSGIVFEMGLRIRADRKHLLGAIGMVAVGIAGMMTTLQIALETVMKCIQTTEALSMDGLVGRIGLMGAYLTVLMIGMLVGALYKRLGALRCIMILLSSLGIILYCIYRVDLYMARQGKVLHTYKPMLSLIGGMVIYVLNTKLLYNLPLGGYQIQK